MVGFAVSRGYLRYLLLYLNPKTYFYLHIYLYLTCRLVGRAVVLGQVVVLGQAVVGPSCGESLF